MLNLVLRLISSLFQSRRSLILENVALRHQLQVLGHQKKRPRLTNRDRAVWILLRRMMPDWKRSLVIVRPETVIGWHRCGFRAFWRRKSQRRSRGRPLLNVSERELIRQMAHDNPTWGAPRITGPTTVAKYMNLTGPPSQSWKTFLQNHAEEIVSIDLFTVPTLSCQVLYVFLMVHNASRRIVHFNVTTNPTMEWTARQLLEAFPWDSAPKYILRDNDGIYGQVFLEQLDALGIEDVPTAPGSPWQNPYVEQLIGTVRRDCLDHVIVLGERHLIRVLQGRPAKLTLG